MSQYEFYEYREQEYDGEVSTIVVVCEYQRRMGASKRIRTTWSVEDGVASFAKTKFYKHNGDTRKKRSIRTSTLKRVVAIAVQKIEERGYEVDSPFERESLETALDEGE